jgi:hypothetical protein
VNFRRRARTNAHRRCGAARAGGPMQVAPVAHAALVALAVALAPAARAGSPIANPLIDYDGFQRIVESSKGERESHRLDEAGFLAGMAQPGVIVLDARSESRYRLRHVKGAVNLPFTEFTAETLAQVVPTRDTKVLIYCNNNFRDSPRAFAEKAATASLNLSTWTSLKSYGYTNVYELGPLLAVDTTRIPFEGTEVQP